MKFLYLIIMGLFSGIYWVIFKNTFSWLVNSWMHNSFYAHGFIIILLSLTLIIVNGLKVKDVKFNFKDGLWMWLLALVFVVIGLMMRFNYIIALSYVLLVIALNRTILMKEYIKYLSRPAWLMILVFPLPFLYEISGYMSFISSKVSALLLRILFSSVVVRGIEIIIPPDISFSIGINCGGANSILALATVVVLWTMFIKNSTKVTASVLLMILPVGFLTNVLRIVCIFIIAKAGGMDLAIDFWHDFAGYFFYIISLSMMALTWLLLKKLAKDKMDFRRQVI